MYCYENFIVVLCCCYQILFVNYYNNYFEIKLINLFDLGIDNIKHGIIILIGNILVYASDKIKHSYFCKIS
jgi:hypothetical protein